MLLVVCGLLFDVRCVFVRCVLFVGCCGLVVVGSLWRFVCCYTVVARCSRFVVYVLSVVSLLVVGCVIGGCW